VSAALTSSALRAEYFNQEAMTQEEAYLRWFLSDGAGAVVLESSDTKRDGVFVEATHIESYNKPSVMGNVNPGYWINPKTTYEKKYHHLFQKMDQISNHVVNHDRQRTIFVDGVERMAAKNGIDLNGLRYYQINMPSKQTVDLILEESEKHLNISKDSLYTKISSMGYPGPPACLICLDKILREEELNPKDMILSYVLEVSKFMTAGFVMQCW
jgi:3-oxoacyl-[acyl-carrier-protein] synthase III